MAMNHSRNPSHSGWVVTVLAVYVAWIGSSGRAQETTDFCDPDGVQNSGAIYRLCVPPAGSWNGELIVFAPGFVAPTEPVAIPEGQLVVGDTSLPELANALGYAFAVTSYSTTGFAVPEGLADVVDLVDVFTAQYGPPARIYLIGASQGGLITVIALESYPDVFDGGLSLCAALGDFAEELNYVGDFRLLFDYFFPGILPGDPTAIPQEVIDDWDAVYVPAVRQAIWSDVPRTLRLLHVAQAPVDAFYPANLLDSIDQTVLTLLWYNVFATNDAIAKLGGSPFDNTTRWYSGSGFDWWLNRRIPRYAADPVALQHLEAYYSTTGALGVPVVTAHTVLDEVIPYDQQLQYQFKNLMQGDWLMNTHLPVFRYGHCNFTVDELLIAFGVMIARVTGDLPGDWDAPLVAVDRSARWPCEVPPLSPLTADVKALQAGLEFERLLEMVEPAVRLPAVSAPGSGPRSSR
jgi:pimeloyl-ACP methyl ester carboxylesterase